jgi:hypothetical protein
VQGDDLVGAKVLAQQVLGGQRLQLTEELVMPPKCQVSLDAVLERVQPQLVETRDLGIERPVRVHVRVRVTAPHRQSVRQPGSRPVRLVLEFEKRRLVGRLEPNSFDSRRRNVHDVAVAAALDHISQITAEVRDVGLDGPARSGRRILPVHGEGELVCTDTPPDSLYEHGEHRALLRASEGHGPVGLHHRKRSEDV